METRLALVTDAPVLAALHAASFTHGVWNLQQLTDSLAQSTVSTWLATEENKIQGFIMLQQAGDEAEILTLCTSPDARRKGFADALVKQAWAQSHSTKIFLEVAADNIAAQKLYEKHGFKITGKRPHYYQRDTGAVDALMLALDL